jgi:hypothetical protein
MHAAAACARACPPPRPGACSHHAGRLLVRAAEPPAEHGGGHPISRYLREHRRHARNRGAGRHARGHARDRGLAQLPAPHVVPRGAVLLRCAQRRAQHLARHLELGAPRPRERRVAADQLHGERSRALSVAQRRARSRAVSPLELAPAAAARAAPPPDSGAVHAFSIMLSATSRLPPRHAMPLLARRSSRASSRAARGSTCSTTSSA